MRGCCLIFFFYMCILFTGQLTQAACEDKYDNNKYADKMQKKDKCRSSVNIRGADREARRGSLRYSKSRKKGDMTEMELQLKRSG